MSTYTCLYTYTHMIARRVIQPIQAPFIRCLHKRFFAPCGVRHWHVDRRRRRLCRKNAQTHTNVRYMTRAARKNAETHTNVRDMTRPTSDMTPKRAHLTKESEQLVVRDCFRCYGK